MLNVEQEGEWLADLPEQQKFLFLSTLGHELTIVGRNSYKPQTEELEKPAQLRRVNEAQHRVLACLVQSLRGTCERGFQQSIATQVLLQEDQELRNLMSYAWERTRAHLAS